MLVWLCSFRWMHSHLEHVFETKQDCLNRGNITMNKAFPLNIKSAFLLDWKMETPAEPNFYPNLRIFADLLSEWYWLDLEVRQKLIFIPNTTALLHKPPLIQEDVSFHGGDSHSLSNVRLLKNCVWGMRLTPGKTTFNTTLKVDTDRFHELHRILTALGWISYASFQEDQLKYFVSLVGRIQKVEVSSQVGQVQRNLTMFVFEDKILNEANERQQVKHCHSVCYKKSCLCLHYPSTRLNGTATSSGYIFIQHILHTPLFTSQTFSWAEAAERCRSLQRHLPMMRSREEMNNFLTFLMVSEEIPQVFAIYIGLQGHQTHVSLSFTHIITHTIPSMLQLLGSLITT